MLLRGAVLVQVRRDRAPVGRDAGASGEAPALSPELAAALHEAPAAESEPAPARILPQAALHHVLRVEQRAVARALLRGELVRRPVLDDASLVDDEHPRKAECVADVVGDAEQGRRAPQLHEGVGARVLVDDVLARSGGRDLGHLVAVEVGDVGRSALATVGDRRLGQGLSLIHISEPTRPY